MYRVWNIHVLRRLIIIFDTVYVFYPTWPSIYMYIWKWSASLWFLLWCVSSSFSGVPQSLSVIFTHTSMVLLPFTGNANRTLLTNPDLYISRDGGVTWEETLAGSWGVNVADHGGLMVAARDYHQQRSTELMYSCNEGYTWSSFTFSPVSYLAINRSFGSLVFNCSVDIS